LVVAIVFGVLLARFDKGTNPVVYLLGYCAYLAVSVLLMQRLWINRWLQPGEDWTPTAAVARARLRLAQSLTSILECGVLVFACGVVDSLGQSVFVAFVRGRPVELATSGGVIALLLALARKFATMAVTPGTSWMKVIVRFQKWIALVVALVAMLAIAALL